MLNNLPQIRLKLLLKKQFKATAKTNGNLIGNRIANKVVNKKVTDIPRTSPQNSSGTVECKTEIPRERYISPEQRHKIIDHLVLISLLDNTLTINLLDNKPHQPSNFRTKNCVELNDEASV